MIPVFLKARNIFEPRASKTPDIEFVEVDAGSEPRAVMIIDKITKSRSKLKLTLPRIIIRMEVNRGSDILIKWVREAELRPRLKVVNKEP